MMDSKTTDRISAWYIYFRMWEDKEQEDSLRILSKIQYTCVTWTMPIETIAHRNKDQ
jgi:hypothetical protein